MGALLITGAPGMLSGGFDLKVMRSSAAAAGQLVTDGGALFTRFLGSEVPVVIACSGHAVAAGALMLLGADERVGARGEFRIGLIETEIGMVLPVWAAELARERLSPRQLQIATVGAKMYDPDGALEAGYPRRGGRPRSARGDGLRGRGPLGQAPAGRLPRPGAREPGRGARPPRRRDRGRPGPGLRRSRLASQAARPAAELTEAARARW